jgi:hypothetical protein
LYRLVAETFAGREFRAVFCPLSTGRKSHSKTQNPPPETQGGDSSLGAMPSLPPGEPGGGGGSDPVSGSPLVKAFELVKRSDSDLEERYFSRKAAETVRRIGTAAEILDTDRRNWVFCTLTWPTGSREGMAVLARNTPWIIQFVKNHFRSKDYAQSDYFYVWERQRRGTLHLHWIQHVRAGSSERRIDSDFRAAAYRASTILSSRSGTNLLLGEGGDWSQKPEVLRNSAERVRRSISRYLSKYLSKGSRAESAHWAKLGSPSPRRWWGASVSLKEKVKELTETNRVDFSSYRAAANSFQELIDISMLRLLPNQVCRHYLSECSGESFTAFTERPLWKLVRLWKSYKSSSLVKSPTLMTTPTTMQQSAQSPSLDFVLGLLLKTQNRPDYPTRVAKWASQVVATLMECKSKGLNSGYVRDAIRQAIREGTTLQFSRSRCNTPPRIKYESEMELQKILQELWRLSSLPAGTDMVWTGLSAQTKTPTTPTTTQMTIFGSDGIKIIP